MIRVAVMEGSLTEFDIPSVIQVVSIGRQYTGVDFSDEAGQVIGTMFLKSGKIVSATSGERSGVEAVAALLRGKRHKRFSVFHAHPFDDVQSPVGSVAEILVRLLASEKEARGLTPVMDGSLEEFDLVTVLQVISIGRGLMVVEVRTALEQVLGWIELKSAQVVSASCAHLEGMDAIRRLMRAPRDSRFLVFRSDAEIKEQSVGPLGRVLLQLNEASEDSWAPAEPHTREHAVIEPRPASVAAAPIAAAASEAPPSPAVAKESVEARGAPPPPQPLRESSSFVDMGANARDGETTPLRAGVVPVVCVTGPKGGAGKTTIAINLGVALARRGKRVVLVDGDSNGVLIVLNAEKRAARGAHDVLTGAATLEEVTISTRIPGLRIVPTGEGGGVLPAGQADWGSLLEKARAQADIVLVDLPPGLSTGARDIAALCTHAMVVIPAEPAALRALPAYMRRLESLGKDPPKVLGIALNMLDYRARVSLEVLRDICGGPYGAAVFDVPIARSPAFMEAVTRGVPMSCGERADTPTIGWVFEMLASGMLERLGAFTPAFDEAPLL